MSAGTKPEPCRGCPYEDQPGPVWPDGVVFDGTDMVPSHPGIDPFSRDIAFFGMGPGQDEIAAAKGLVGPAGQEHWKLAGAVGIERSACYVSNVVKCLPVGVTTKGDHSLDPRAIEHCKFYRDKELAKCRAKVVVTLGAEPLEALWGREVTRITHLRGAVLLLPI